MACTILPKSTFVTWTLHNVASLVTSGSLPVPTDSRPCHYFTGYDVKPLLNVMNKGYRHSLKIGVSVLIS